RGDDQRDDQAGPEWRERAQAVHRGPPRGADVRVVQPRVPDVLHRAGLRREAVAPAPRHADRASGVCLQAPDVSASGRTDRACVVRWAACVSSLPYHTEAAPPRPPPAPLKNRRSLLRRRGGPKPKVGWRVRTPPPRAWRYALRWTHDMDRSSSHSAHSTRSAL